MHVNGVLLPAADWSWARRGSLIVALTVGQACIAGGFAPGTKAASGSEAQACVAREACSGACLAIDGVDTAPTSCIGWLCGRVASAVCRHTVWQVNIKVQQVAQQVEDVGATTRHDWCMPALLNNADGPKQPFCRQHNSAVGGKSAAFRSVVFLQPSIQSDSRNSVNYVDGRSMLPPA